MTARRDSVSVFRLFVYGTLQDDTLVHRLIGRPLPGQPATLDGFHRMIDPAIGYPVVHRATGQRVDGKLLDGLDDRALQAFDAYEGDRYRRTVVQVRTRDGHAVDAFVYVPANSSRPG